MPEWAELPAATAGVVTAARRRGSRVIAVGTTVTRALESAVRRDRVIATRGWTDLVITPERGTRAVTGLLTGWHEADASHLLLLEAVAGPDLVGQAYAEALAGAYTKDEDASPRRSAENDGHIGGRIGGIAQLLADATWWSTCCSWCTSPWYPKALIPDLRALATVAIVSDC